MESKKAPFRAGSSVLYTPIGWVRGAPQQVPPEGWATVRSEIATHAAFEPAIRGLDGYSHIWVVFALDGVDERGRATLSQRPPGVPSDVGVFALRTQARPNPIGIAVVRLVSVDGTTLHVEGLDAFDGTPVLDLKPYIPYYDSVPDARVPAWIGHP